MVLLHSSLKSERETEASRIGVNPGNEVVCFHHLQSSHVKHTPFPQPQDSINKFMFEKGIPLVIAATSVKLKSALLLAYNDQ